MGRDVGLGVERDFGVRLGLPVAPPTMEHGSS